MPKNHLRDVPNRESAGEHEEPLLGSSNENENDDSARATPSPLSRHPSAITRPPANGLPRTPRTPNRVRFEIDERRRSSSKHEVEDPENEEDEDRDEDRFSRPRPSSGRRNHAAQRAPLLTGIEAPSVTVASTDLDDEVEDLLENPRPKSGMLSAFMNMANSIM